MLSFYSPKIPQLMNNTMYDYCKRTTQDSIRKITEKYNLERNIKNRLDDNDDIGQPQNNFYGFLFFLSISTIGILLYKQVK
jgi:hypothetical protein